ncbi:TetR/AcrR family transcriptional regulator [Kutzneria sp. 744]|uniref:TetR/AcrR family transcriptional regulator n=1 Tax=Kutzneria sp. (strain 744) TaxID=345341 RepID=UPI0003EECAC7|nr:TetR/AcrR family transcriptional regulator [Kutzneria sp. 744]EWM19381.1 TetR-family transcriptional regulator [Kutzneria sp. 744]
MADTYNRRERPAKPALSRDGIVATALAVMRSEGMEKVTMRRLAKELDTGPASLYVYVKDTEELHAAMLDELLGGVELDPGPDGDWRARLWRVMTSYRRVLFDHPGLARVALVARLSGPNYLAVIEAVLARLAEGGMPRAQAGWTVDLLMLVATASAVEQGTRRASGAAADHDLMISALLGASAQTYPNIAAHAVELTGGPAASRSRWMFDVLLSGAFGTPTPGEGDLP